MSLHPHKKNLPTRIKVGVITVSTTRSEQEDLSGQWIQSRLGEADYPVVFYRVVKDDQEIILQTVKTAIALPDLQALIVNGGTGISAKDVTIEAVRPLFEKELTAFGPLFAQLSYAEIGSAALLSRATAGLCANRAVFCIPGSVNACKLACNELIMPELGHVIKHIQKG